jgi:hypothetical protein
VIKYVLMGARAMRSAKMMSLARTPLDVSEDLICTSVWDEEAYGRRRSVECGIRVGSGLRC